MKKDILISLAVFCIIGIILYALAVIPERFNSMSKEDNTIVFWTLQMGDFAPYINKVIKNYEKENNIKIKWVDVPFSEGEKRTLAAILSDNPPDLINLNPDFSAILAEKGALEDIYETEFEQFNENIINALKYNNRVYSLPWYATSAVTIYNKTLYNKAGYTTPPENYEQLLQIAPKLKAKSEVYVLMPTITENDTMLKILNKYGAATQDTINNSVSAEVFKMFKDMFDNGIIPKESVTQTQREALEKYMAGQLIFFQSGANFLNMIKENAPSVYEQTDVSKQLTGSFGQNDFSLMTLVIPLKAKKKQEALKFALYLTNKENQLELAKLTNIIAVNKEALKDEYYTKYSKGDLLAKARCISAKQLNNIEPTLKQSRGQKEINLLINTAVQEILLNNSDIQETLDNVAKKWQELQ